ncbi:zinc finger protein [Elysia marginata]|uniref:Zinc finger protein n=1 Tax=Elysia marginata TaxID=1093978 RepID=A0AAV4HFQ0_9GAST|nr:zinc finger protein [Elysia marginata]
MPYAMRLTLRDELKKMEDLEIIRKSSLPYSSPVVVVKKKDDSNRMCIDYRWLNKLTIFYPQPMTPPADVFQGMEKDQYFLKLDIIKGYWQILVRKEDIPKTAFVTMDCHYEFLRMPFGMMNSGATLTRGVKKLLCGMDNVVDYIDDLLVHTETWEAHVETLAERFRRLREANFTFAVTSKPVLQLPDINKRFILRTNATGRELGAAGE